MSVNPSSHRVGGGGSVNGFCKVWGVRCRVLGVGFGASGVGLGCRVLRCRVGGLGSRV